MLRKFSSLVFSELAKSVTCQFFHNFSWKILDSEAKVAVFYSLLFQAFKGLPSDFFLTIKKSAGENQVTPQMKKLLFLTHPSLWFFSQLILDIFHQQTYHPPCSLSSFLSPFKTQSRSFYRALTNPRSAKICWLPTVNSLQEGVTYTAATGAVLAAKVLTASFCHCAGKVRFTRQKSRISCDLKRH